MLLFVFFGIMMIWPFPAIVLAGAAIGIVTRLVLHKQAR
jgi:hypothetical protein